MLSVLTYHLNANPAVLQTLQKELETAMPEPDSDVSWSQLEQLPYLTAVVTEALRISSPVTTRLPRIAPVNELEVQGWCIPAGTPTSMSYYFMHHNPALFPEPSRFLPERWLTPESKDTANRLDRYLVPFCKGSRNCVGINLAQAELYLTVAMVFRRFNFELIDTVRERDVDIAGDHFTAVARKDSKGVNFKIVGLRE